MLGSLCGHTLPPGKNQVSASDQESEPHARLTWLFSNEYSYNVTRWLVEDYFKNGLNQCLEIFTGIQKRTRPGEHPEDVSAALLGASSVTHLVA